MNSIRSKIGLQFIVSNGSIAAYFGLSVVLARLLSPAEIGIFSITAVFVGFTQVFRDFGVVAFIKSQKNLTNDMLRASMGVLFTSSWVIAAFLYFLADTLSIFFKQPGIREIMPVLALGFVFIPFGSIPQAVLVRSLEVQKTTYSTLMSTIVYITTCITLAYHGFSYMSMAWANLANIICSGILLTAMMPKGLPHTPSFRGWKNVVRFGAGALLTSSIKAVDVALPDIFLGKLSGAHSVGIFSRSNSTVNILNTVTGPTLDYFALPYLAKAHHAGAPLNIEMVRTTAILTGIIWSALAATSVLAGDIILFLYGPNWMECVPAIPWLCVAIGVQLTFATVQPALTAIGKPYASALPAGILLLVKVFIAMIFYDGNIVSFARAIAFAEFSAILSNCFVAKFYLNMKMFHWKISIEKSAFVFILILLQSFILKYICAEIPSAFLRVVLAIAWLIPSWYLTIFYINHPLKEEIDKIRDEWRIFFNRKSDNTVSSKMKRYARQVVLYGAVANPPAPLNGIRRAKFRIWYAAKSLRDVRRWHRSDLTQLDYRDYMTPSTYNLGDEAIVRAGRQTFLRRFPDLDVLVANWGDRSLFSEPASSDMNRIIVVCGSGYIMFDSAGALAARIGADLSALLATSIPLVLYGIGVNRFLETDVSSNPFNSNKDESIIRLLLERASLISVRDRESQRILSEYTDKKISLIGDPALFFCDHGPFPHHVFFNSNSVRPKIGINLPFHFREVNQKIQADFSGYVAMLKNLQQSTNCEYFYMIHFETEKIIAQLLKSSGIALSVISGPPEVLCQSYAQLNLHIGGMLHSCILASAAGTPSIALAYDTKHSGFFELLGLQEYCIPSTPFDAPRILGAAFDALKSEHDIRKVILKSRHNLELDIQNFFTEVFNIFFQREKILKTLDIEINAPKNIIYESNLRAPRVSVIMPVRNGIEYIAQAINSVLTQSFSDLELIVIDDGSDDYEYMDLESYDHRIRVIRLDGKGVSVARNTGIIKSRGDLIAFLDADDYWFPGKLEAQVNYLNLHPNIGFVFGRYLRWIPDKNNIFARPEKLGVDCSNVTVANPNTSGWMYTRLLTGSLIGMSSAIMRKSICSEVGLFNESMRIGEDYDYWFRISRVTEMHGLDTLVSLYRSHRQSVMANISTVNYTARLLSSVELNWGLINPDQTKLEPTQFSRHLAKCHFAHGYNHYWRGDIRIAKREFMQALRGSGIRKRATTYYILASLVSVLFLIRKMMGMPVIRIVEGKAVY